MMHSTSAGVWLIWVLSLCEMVFGMAICLVVVGSMAVRNRRLERFLHLVMHAVLVSGVVGTLVAWLGPMWRW
jgi:hypothetical protein